MKDDSQLESRAHQPLRPLSFQARPPCLGPHRRELGAEEAARFERWLRVELALEPSARVEVSEWVSADCRETPHTTLVSVASAARHFAFSIGKAVSEIERADLPERRRGLGLPSERGRSAARPRPSPARVG